MNMRTNLSLVAAMAGLLVSCASNTPAPIIDRAPPLLLERTTAVELKPGEYMVKRGDTLYGIALDHGQDHRDIAAWNNLDNPNLIKIGQVLRVRPPETAVENGPVAETRPVAPPPQIESHPVTNESLKREPKGGTQPYSDEAWAQMQKSAAVPAQAKPAEPGAASGVKSATTVVPVVADINWAWPTANKTATPFSEGSTKGIDFDGAVGDSVLAAASGKVTLVTNSLRGYGNLIVVKHNTTYLSVYAHNSKMLVTEGQAVSKGQKIAEIGSSDSDHPNLHFEIRREGKPVDPTKYLPAR
jgi:lipoprotein NlpD